MDPQGMPRGEMPGAPTAPGTEVTQSDMPSGRMTDSSAAPSSATDMPSGTMDGGSAGNLATADAGGMPTGAMNTSSPYSGSAGVEGPAPIELPGVWTLTLTPAARK